MGPTAQAVPRPSNYNIDNFVQEDSVTRGIGLGVSTIRPDPDEARVSALRRLNPGYFIFGEGVMLRESFVRTALVLVTVSGSPMITSTASATSVEQRIDEIRAKTAEQASESKKVHVLYRTELPNGMVFFWDASRDQLMLQEVYYDEMVLGQRHHGRVVRSNAAVIVFQNSTEADRDTSTKDVIWIDGPQSELQPYHSPWDMVPSRGVQHDWSIEASLDSWVDILGYVHTVAALQRQMASHLPPTGLMDRATVWVMSKRMHADLDPVLQKMTLDFPQPVQESVKTATQALTDYDSELGYVQFTREAVPPTRTSWPNWLFYYRGLESAFKGFLGEDLPGTVRYSGAVGYRYIEKDVPTDVIDPAKFDPAASQRIARLEAEARRAVREAVAAFEQSHPAGGSDR